MRIQDLSPLKGSRKARKRIGRGTGSGHGKTACRGQKGQKSRSGGGVRPGFEGGQMPMQRRLPKRGFTNLFRVEFKAVNLRDLDRFEAGASVGPEELIEAGLIGKNDQVKLLGQGDVTRALQVKVHRVSGSARSKIEAAGGAVELI
ncbi:MAG: 50S ribosomal protein L15 [Deltaproteobacteria bacterium]|nr:50S ribosomal protein L15 [Deltaproteobacteria bacterium]